MTYINLDPEYGLEKKVILKSIEIIEDEQIIRVFYYESHSFEGTIVKKSETMSYQLTPTEFLEWSEGSVGLAISQSIIMRLITIYE
jgi:hypothetical protein